MLLGNSHPLQQVFTPEARMTGNLQQRDLSESAHELDLLWLPFLPPWRGWPDRIPKVSGPQAKARVRNRAPWILLLHS